MTDLPSTQPGLRRRDFLSNSLMAGAGTLGSMALSGAAFARSSPGTSEIHWKSISELTSNYASKSLSPVEVTRHVLARISKLDPVVHAYTTVDWEGAVAQAKAAESAIVRGDALGPLHGIPISIKDLLATKGLRTTMGSKFFENNVPERDEILVERLRKAGAIIIGKTNTSEFGAFTSTKTFVTGETLNAWDQTRIAGASSGGAGASCALGMSSFAIGTDGGGSTRIPACHNGLFGFFPSAGRIPMRRPASIPFSQPGPITQSVQDAAIMMSVIGGYDPRDPSSIEAPAPDFVGTLNKSISGMKVGWTRDFGRVPVVDSRAVDLIEKGALRLTEAGAIVDVADILLPDDDMWSMYMGISTYSRPNQLRAMNSAELELITPPVREVMGQPGSTDADIASILETRLRCQEWINGVFAKYDLICSPIFSFIAPKITNDWSSPYKDPDFLKHHSTSYTYMANALGLPAASVPCGFVDGVPVGLQIIGPRFSDARVFQCAHAFSEIQPWMGKHPALAMQA